MKGKKIILRIAVSVGILAALIWHLDLTQLKHVLTQADYRFLLIIFLLFPLAFYLQGYRWYIFLKASGYDWPFGKVQAVSYMSMFFDTFTPGKVGSDFYRLFFFRGSGREHQILGSLLALRIQGLMINIVYVLVFGGLFYVIRSFNVFFVALLALLPFLPFLLMRIFFYIGFAMLLFIKKRFLHHVSINNHIEKLSLAMQEMSTNHRALIFSNLIAIIYVFLAGIIYYTAGMAFQIHTSFIHYLFVAPILVLSGVIPFTINGRGVVELVAILLLKGDAASAEQVLTMCLGVYAIILCHGLISGLFLWCFTFSYRQRK